MVHVTRIARNRKNENRKQEEIQNKAKKPTIKQFHNEIIQKRLILS